MPTNRWFNVSVALDSPGRAAVCGWGFLSCSLASEMINLGWLLFSGQSGQ